MPEVKGKRTIVSIAEAEEILEKIDQETADQIQKRTLDYVSKFSKVSAGEAKKMRVRLKKECGLSEEEAAELVNIMPKSVEELRLFTAGWKKLLPTETLEKILKILGQEK